MSKFDKGDRVEVINPRSSFVGDQGVITVVNPVDHSVVEFDYEVVLTHNHLTDGRVSFTIPFDEGELKLVDMSKEYEVAQDKADDLDIYEEIWD